MDSKVDAKVDGKDERYSIRVLDRAFRVLFVLADGKPRLLTELSEEAGLSNSTTFRLLAALSLFRFVEREELTGRYKLGLGCLELARVYLHGNSLREAALTELQKLRDDTLEAVHLAVLHDMEVVYLEKLEGLHAVGIMTSRVGSRAPSYCTGLGKALLAHANQATVRSHFHRVGLRSFTSNTLRSVDELVGELREARQKGYSLDRGEHEVEVRCVAVPIFDSTGMAVAAISVAGPASRMEPLETNHDLIARVLQAASSISLRLGSRQVSAPAERPLVSATHVEHRDG